MSEQTPRIRIGVVSYLNARPLTFCLRDLAPDAQVSVDVPSRLADGLAAGTLDEGSRTSAALTRILLKERFGMEPRLEALPIGAACDDSTADAVMLVGDRGLRPADGPFHFVWDLGEQWARWTGLPFVFAMWVARPEVDLSGMDETLAAARDDGVGRLAQIARLDAPALGLPESECLSYLRDHLEFRLGQRQLSGLQLFCDLASRHAL